MTRSSDPAAAVAAGLGPAPGHTVGIAVSGGSDSVALLLLAEGWARSSGRGVAAITVDHGLRPEAAAEAATVAAICVARGIPHAIRRWQGADGGNLQHRARDARRGLIADWARAEGIAAVALGHTQDDQAETFLLRLARGSGVDGLAGIAPASTAAGLLWLRPLLGVSRADLQAWLVAQGVPWAEDPSNRDLRFDRVRVRAALPRLAGLGLDTARLAATATAMARARSALEAATAELARRAAQPRPWGEVILDPAVLAAAPEELRLRLLAGSLAWVAGARYRPRLASLAAAEAAIRAGRVGHGLTLHGCVLRPVRDGIALRREPARLGPAVPASVTWDNRWEITDPPAGLTLGGLGAADLAGCADWRGRGISREALLATPALRDGERLVAAPFLGIGHVLPRRVAPLTPPWIPAIVR